MTNNLPATTSTPASVDVRAARSLSTQCGRSISVERAGGEWILSAGIGLTSGQLRNGLAALDQELAGGPTQRIAASLMKLVSVTRQPSWMDDEKSVLYFATIQEAMMDYPVEIVEQSLNDWRKGPNGEWWPAEAELRRMCEQHFASCRALRAHAQRLLLSLEQEEDRAERARKPSYFPGDKHKSFREGMRKRMSPSRFDAYFHSTHIKFASDSEVLVRTSTAHVVLNEEGADLLKELGLRLRHCAEAFRGEGDPPYEEVTQEQREQMANRLRALARQISGAKPSQRRTRSEASGRDDNGQRTEEQVPAGDGRLHDQ